MNSERMKKKIVVEITVTVETSELLAEAFHESYERLAPKFGYETKKESAVAWNDVPENQRKLMMAVCAEILEAERE